MLKHQGVLLVSLVAMFAVTSGYADIASTKYVDDEIDALATVASTGSYTDLSNTPDIDSIESDLAAVWDTDITEALVNRVAANEGAIETLNGTVSDAGSVDYKIAQAIGGQDFSGKQDNIGGSTNAGKAVIATSTAGTVDYRVIDTTSGGTTGSNSLITSGAVYSGLSGKQDTISDLSSIRSNATAGAGAANTIATYGDIVTHDADDFATAAQGGKADSAIQSVKVNGSALTADANKAVNVTVPTTTSQLTNNSGFITSADVPTKVSDLTNDTGFITSADVPAQVRPDWDATTGVASIANKPTLATVATSGSYADLSNKPTAVSDFTNDTGFITSASLPTKVSDLTNDTGFVTAADQVQPNWNATSGKGQILNKPTAVSAFTNDAGYLTAHQTLPTVNTSSGAGNVVTNVTQTNGAIAVTKGRVQIPVGAEDANTYAAIWVE